MPCQRPAHEACSLNTQQSDPLHKNSCRRQSYHLWDSLQTFFIIWVDRRPAWEIISLYSWHSFTLSPALSKLMHMLTSEFHAPNQHSVSGELLSMPSFPASLPACCAFVITHDSDKPAQYATPKLSMHFSAHDLALHLFLTGHGAAIHERILQLWPQTHRVSAALSSTLWVRLGSGQLAASRCRQVSQKGRVFLHAPSVVFHSYFVRRVR